MECRRRSASSRVRAHPCGTKGNGRFATRVGDVLDRGRPRDGDGCVRLIEGYMDELAAALHERGRNRRRILEECRAHLVEAAAERGEAEAVRAFGQASTIAAQLDTESATRRSL